MSESLLGLFMDGLVLVFLGATIFFAVRLSAHLKNFRDGRKDLERLIHDLSTQIDKAEHSIDALKTSARDIARDLQQQLDEAKTMSAELEIMTRGANNMADRLDKSAERHRGNDAIFDQSTAPVRGKPVAGRDEFPGFAIRDAEAERGGDLSPDSGESVAERELLEALQSRKHR